MRKPLVVVAISLMAVPLAMAVDICVSRQYKLADLP
jgi:hypothetical protein